MDNQQSRQFVIIGGGPAGLTAGYELTKHNIRPIVLEQYDKVGGLARTENYKGYHFDMGGHRFFTKSQPVNEMWQEVLGEDFLRRPRLSRIFYHDKFFFYPLKVWNALSGLGIWQAILIVLSFVRWQIFPHKKEETFEQWVTNRFGKRLFEIFFKTYTEKVWGISCSELKAEWAVQRIKNLSLKTALLGMLVKPGDQITSLIEEFHYPRFGPGMLWNEVKDRIEKRDGQVLLNSSVTRFHRTGNCIDYVVVSQNGSGEQIIHGTDFISSMPVSEFVKKLDPVPAEVLEAANQLSYRDFLTVCLIVNKRELFPDNWIYIHSPEVKVGRIQNFKNWSPEMVPDESKTSLGLEYFCTEGDALWNMPDMDLIELGKRELERIGLAQRDDIVDGCVFRVPKAYPVYDADYAGHLQTVRDFVDGLANFQTVGRNGLHRYNNQDHSMITASLAVRNLLFGEQNDLWNVNADAEYHEEIRQDVKSAEETLKERITHSFPRLDPVAFGFSLGLTSGMLIFAATLFLIFRDGANAGPHLALLSNFVPGFAVTVPGAMIGLLGLFLLGFFFGSILAYLRNLAVFVGARTIHRDLELYHLRRLFDFI